MPPKGFTDSFFSPDYAGGLGVLFQKLNQGCVANEQLLSLARARADAEESYGIQIQELARNVVHKGGLPGDEGASARKAFDGMRKEMEEAGKNHVKVAQNLDAMAIRPFGRWSTDHLTRVNHSHDELQAQVKAYDRQVEQCKKLRQNYYNKCRLLEDLEEETNLAFPTQNPTTEEKGKAKEGTPPVVVEEPPKSPVTRKSSIDDDEWPLEIGDAFYSKDELSALMSRMIREIPQKEVKVPILGTYKNCAPGASIVDWLTKTLGPMTLPYAEKIGQDLGDQGYFRLIGAVGRTFTNSSVFNYQFTKKAFAAAGGDNAPIRRTDTLIGQAKDVPYVGEMLGSWMGTGAVEGETQMARLKREVKESEGSYKESVFVADRLRCRLEELMMDHMNFMERCELDRLKAFKSVLLDISASLSNIIPGIQASIDNMLLYQETIQPEKDLRFMIESYRTGGFAPKVLVYENYYNSAEEQTFGVDIQLRARVDHKRVPNIISGILIHLDERYAEMEDNEKRKAMWLTNVSLSKTHELRAKLNTGQPPDPEILEAYEPATIASVLKLYLLELPDPIMSFTVYDIVKSIYASNNNLEDLRARISAIQNTLSQLHVTNIATLDALTQHFARFIEITDADEEWVSELAHALAYCFSRPRVESSVTQHDRHSHRLITDLLANREKIFKELKRASRGVSGAQKRPESLDESHRRERYEARARAVSSAAKSPRLAPADSPNGERSPGMTHARRISGISGILQHRAPALSLEPGESLQLDGGLPAGGDDEGAATETGPVDVVVTDESVAPVHGETPIKKPSLGRSHRIGGRPAGGLQRHIKRESLQAAEVGGEGVQDRDAAAVAANTKKGSDGTRYSVTLSDGPLRD